MADRKDRELLSNAIRRGWNITPERKARYFAALDAVLRESADLSPSDRLSAVVGANRILQMEQDAALRDLHQREKDARLDAGKPTEIAGLMVSTPLTRRPVVAREATSTSSSSE